MGADRVGDLIGMRVLVTGGAGFVGGSMAIGLAQRHSDWEVVVLDNLRRRGSELNLARLRTAGVAFIHGDVRDHADLRAIGPIDALVECSAEPSVQAGLTDGPDYVVRTNILGAYHCLELARLEEAYVVFLSTSRVYPLDPLRALHLDESDTRFELADDQQEPGVSAAGISERFPLEGARTFYGTSKLAGEMLIAEYASAFGLRAVVDRFGVIAGPWQMGKVDQGVFAHWVASHHFGRPLSYFGYGGSGKQVRDVLHIEDAVDLIDDQLSRPDHWAGLVANVGGGREFSLSLLEATALCEEVTGNAVAIQPRDEPSLGDVPLYLSDSNLLYTRTDWRPRRPPKTVIEDIHSWVADNEVAVRAALGW